MGKPDGIENDWTDISYQLVEGTNLKTYMEKRGKGMKFFRGWLNMDRLAHTLKEVMVVEGMLTDKSHGIVFCTPELEGVLDVKAFHIKEFATFFRLHMRPLTYSKLMEKIRVHKKDKPRTTPDVGEPISLILDDEYLNPVRRFNIKEGLRALYNTIPGHRHEAHHEFSYVEVMELFRQYCIAKKLIDYRNVRVAILQGDPMATVLDRVAVYQDQIPHLFPDHVVCTNRLFENGSDPGVSDSEDEKIIVD
jgi:hypothetical protein